MPLIDSSESLIDDYLTQEFNHRFSCFQNGQILDENGNPWMIWNLLELERWWSIFESNIGIPFGRKLFNSCVDEEEFQLYDIQLFNSGWFSKKKNLSKLSSRWEILGWGEIDVNNFEIRTNLPSGIGPGLALAAIEAYSKSRFKSEWKQKNLTDISLNLSPDPKILSIAKKHSSLPWHLNSDQLVKKDKKFELELRSLGWSIDGEPMIILPVSLFSRLFHSSLGYETSMGEELLDSWNISGIEVRFSKPLIVAAYSTFQLFIDSDKHVYIESIDSWASFIELYCSNWGWGDAIELEDIDQTGGIKVKFPVNENLPFFIGLVVGLWHRSYGRKPKVSVIFKDKLCFLTVESLLEYN